MSTKNGSPLAFCNCRMCRAGRKRGGNPKMIRSMVRGHRRLTKQNLRSGDFDRLTIRIAVPYTD